MHHHAQPVIVIMHPATKSMLLHFFNILLSTNLCCMLLQSLDLACLTTSSTALNRHADTFKFKHRRLRLLQWALLPKGLLMLSIADLCCKLCTQQDVCNLGTNATGRSNMNARNSWTSSRCRACHAHHSDAQCCSPAEEGTVKQGANAAHEQLVLHWHSCKVYSLISRPDGDLSSHSWQKVLLKLVAHFLCRYRHELFVLSAMTYAQRSG